MVRPRLSMMRSPFAARGHRLKRRASSLKDAKNTLALPFGLSQRKLPEDVCGLRQKPAMLKLFEVNRGLGHSPQRVDRSSRGSSPNALATSPASRSGSCPMFLTFR
jgi:hypothetical protein